MDSNIPEDCKSLYIAVTIKESGWYKNRNAINKNNYSGFRMRGKLIRFKSLNSYQSYLENWFKRKHIYNRNHLYKLLNSGRYCKFNNNRERYLYIRSIKQIEKQTHGQY